MNRQLVGSVSDVLQTFIELKQQNSLIMAWIQLKKCMKTYGIANYPSRSNDYPSKFHIKSGNSEHYNHKRSYNSSHSNSSASPSYQNYPRMATDYANRLPNQTMFQTFNQKGTTKWQTLQNQDYSHFRSNHNIGITIQSNNELQDSDQFQDIVLDRLSKLQNSVNQMMREKKIKENIRGYVGAPIQHHPKHQNILQNEHFPEYVAPPSAKTEQQSSHRTPQKLYIRQYQNWESSPVTKAKQPQHLKMKYIPLPSTKETPVNIDRIKTMLKQKSYKASSVASNHQKDQQDLIEGVGYFNTVNLKQIKNQEKSYLNQSFDHLHQYDKLKNHFNYANKNEPATKHKLSAQFMYNNHAYSNTTKNKVTPLKFFTNNLEIQSVIEPRTKFVRSPRNHRPNIHSFTAKNIEVKPKQPNNFFKARNSGDSSHSGQSYFSTPAWRSNLTSLH